MPRRPLYQNPWLVGLVLVLAALAIWAKVTVDHQPQTHDDPGIPDLVVPDPEDVE